MYIVGDSKFKKFCIIEIPILKLAISVADSEGVHSNPPLRHNYFIFMENFHMDESSTFPKSLTFETQILKLAICPLNIHILKL